MSISPSDPITAADLKSSQSYRLALHREYIRRLSPRASMKVLAGRLGVDARTVRRYNHLLGVRATATVGRFALTWERLQRLPRARRGQGGRSTAGYWLETKDGYRTPAWRHVGAALLRRGETGLNVCMRRTSMWSLSPDATVAVRYERLSTEQFLRLRLMRDGRDTGSSVAEPLRRLLSRAKGLAAKSRYEKLRLDYDSVSERIPDDKVAETIEAYLCAFDEQGNEVRRPARRGVAYRMLKEFGNGNVFLALRDAYREFRVALAEHAAREGDISSSMELLAPVVA
ncbi:MAG: hypothetical protein OXG78_16220 [Chloroflexi bacterium]|nr:hypothetical protein [Chloroflexota bacterium]